MLEDLLYFDVTLLLIISIFFLLVEYRPPWWKQGQKIIQRIPGPTSVPLFGTSWVFYVGRYSFDQLHLYYEDLRKRFGPVVKEECWGNISVINLFERSDIAKVLKSGSKYPLRPPSEAVAAYRMSRRDRYASVGLVNAQGETWYHLRSNLTPIFSSPKTISDFLPQVQEIADDWCNLLKHSRNKDNLVFNMTDLADRLGLEITCALVLGRRMGFLLPEGETQVGRNLAQAVRQHFLGTRDTYFGLPLWKVFNTPSYKKLMQSEEAIYDLAMELINSAEDATGESAVFQAILKAEVDEREKVAAIVDFIAAGIHTLKNSFLFLLNFVGESSRVQDKVLEEAGYAKACLIESFRLLPTASALARILEEDMELGGYTIKAGSPVVCHFGLACRDERNFKNAGEFIPERWLNESKAETANNSLFLLVPFGVGRRVCPGKRFIEYIVPILLERTIQNFELVSRKMDVKYEFLLSPTDDMTMVFKDRV